MNSSLSITLNTPTPGTTAISFNGEMDENTLNEVRPQIEPVLNDANIKTVIFHFRDLAFINSKGIGYLVAVHAHLAKAGRKLVLCEAQEMVMDVMSLVGLTTIIPYFGSLEEAQKNI